MNSAIQESPDHKPTLLWQHAPWDHIRGAVKRDLVDFDKRNVNLSVDEAEQSLDDILCGIIKKYVKQSKPKRPGPVIWWNSSCQDAYHDKIKLFPMRFSKRDRYHAAINHCRIVQNRAFAAYQKELRVKLDQMDKSSKKVWNLATEISGIDAARSGAAPAAEELASHFATKMIV